MKRLVPLLTPFLLLLSPGDAGAVMPVTPLTMAHWVQATDDGYEVRVVADAGCPELNADGKVVAMTVRAEADANFPKICVAPIPVGTHSAALQLGPQVSASIALPVANPTRILVLGDTGCRIKGATLQACNDPAQWPFPQVAAAAAKLKPQLVIHVGDYLYRESACPQGNAGCAGSPWGDNWTTWKADFYDPAAPLLAAAPIVLTRGNHEDCTRAGPGWIRLQGPSAFDGHCLVHQPLSVLDTGSLRLAVLDDAVSNEPDLDRDVAQVYADELSRVAGLAKPVWFIHHRPTWAAISGPLGIPIGGNMTLIEGSSRYARKGGALIPRNVELMLSGHIHTFEAINYAKDVPPQIVAGNGGDNLDVTPRNLRGAQFLGHAGVTVADGLSVGGFGFLLMTKVPGGWTIDLYDPSARPKGQCRFTEPVGQGVGRLDCPGLKG